MFSEGSKYHKNCVVAGDPAGKAYPRAGGKGKKGMGREER